MIACTFDSPADRDNLVRNLFEHKVIALPCGRSVHEIQVADHDDRGGGPSAQRGRVGGIEQGFGLRIYSWSEASRYSRTPGSSRLLNCWKSSLVLIGELDRDVVARLGLVDLNGGHRPAGERSSRSNRPVSDTFTRFRFHSAGVSFQMGMFGSSPRRTIRWHWPSPNSRRIPDPLPPIAPHGARG